MQQNASWTRSGELLIDGLGVDGRDCTRNEPGWAEPGTMSSLWGRQPSRITNSLLLSPPVEAAEANAEESADQPNTSAQPLWRLARGASALPTAPSTRQVGSCQSCREAARQQHGADCTHCLNCPTTRTRALRSSFSQAARWSRRRGPGGDEEQAHLPSTSSAQPGLGGSSITVREIIGGRTCRPISLMDLRTFLATQRMEGRRSTMYQPASDLVHSPAMEPDISLLGGILQSVEPNNTGSEPSTNLDSEKTLVMSPTQDSRSGDKINALKPAASPTEEGKHGDELDALDFLVAFYRFRAKYHQARPSARSSPDSKLSKQISEGSLTAVHKETLRLLLQFFCDPYANIAASRTPKRLSWMVDVGLISEEVVRRAASLARHSTEPDILAPLAEPVEAYLNSVALPAFFLSKAKNLNRHTENGRLAVGISCLILAILFTVLLALDPSPLYAGPPPAGPVSRWWRLLLAPVWVAGIGQSLAAFTGVCFWLSLRGTREPQVGEIVQRRAMIRSALSGEGDEQAIEEIVATEQQDLLARDRWVAPEVHGMIGRKTDDTPSKARSVTPPPITIPAHAITMSDLDLSGQALGRSQSNDGVRAGSVHNSDAAYSLPASPISAPSPLPLALASPVLKPRRIPVVPLHVTFIRPSALLTDAPSGPATIDPLLARSLTSLQEQSYQDQRLFRRKPLSRLWRRAKHASGFAVDTEPVLDERVRRQQQKAAIKALAISVIITAIVLVISIAVP